MDPDSPPRKRLKQARLPFQVLSHKEKSTDLSCSSKKRKLSEGSDEDIQVTKVIKSTEVEEAKENKSTESPLNIKEAKGRTPAKADVVAEEKINDFSDERPDRHTDQNGLKNQMKLNLLSLFGSKSSAALPQCYDVADSDVSSAEEATEDLGVSSEVEEKRQKSISSQNFEGKTNLSEMKSINSKSGDEKEHDTEEAQENKTRKTPKSNKKKASCKPSGPLVRESDCSPTLELESSGVCEANTNESSSEMCQKLAHESEKKKMLSQKALNLLASWRKNPLPENKSRKESPDEAAVPPRKDAIDDSEAAENVLAPRNASDVEDQSNDSDSPVKGICEEETVTHVMEAEDENVISLSGDESLDEKDNSTTEKINSVTPKPLSRTPLRRLTPKQLEKQKESARKQEEKEKLKLEREKEKQRLKQEKEEQKKKEREEKEEMKKKEREGKEEQRRKEKEEKEKKKQAETEEKRRKEELKAEEKRKKEEDEERKKAKASAMFTSFFVAKSTKTEKEDIQGTPTLQNFMPFEVKADMRMAPLVRRTLDSMRKQHLDNVLSAGYDTPIPELYIGCLRAGKVVPSRTGKTWPVEDQRDDISILEPDDEGIFIEQIKNVEKLRAKLLQFHENERPPYRGTWRKRSGIVTGRTPFAQEKILDYEVDSADEWEEEEPGESLHGSDDEKEQESEDEYEVDNSVFVPHGYLSDDEGDADETENEVLSPETQKAKLKLLGEEFEEQMKSKTKALKPVIIVLTAAMQASALGSLRYQKLLERRAVWREDEGPITLTRGTDEVLEGLTSYDPSSQSVSSGPGAKKKLISEEAIPALITLIHGNQNKRVFLTNEFSAFLTRYRSSDIGTTINQKINVEVDMESPVKPGVSTTPINPLLSKWPNLPGASRASISNKIKELASWGPCPEEGPMFNRQCWYVGKDTLEQYGVSDLKLPNTVWHYTTKPKVTFSQLSASSPCSGGLAGNSSSGDSCVLITKFTKVMTPEEKQREWQALNNKKAANAPSTNKPIPSLGKITSFTCPVKTSNETGLSPHTSNLPSQTSGEATPIQPLAKKRVPLLVSVPRGQQIGQQIGSPAHCSLLSKFEAAAGKPSNLQSPQSPANPETEKCSPTMSEKKCITID